jgi:hypothetical protein
MAPSAVEVEPVAPPSILKHAPIPTTYPKIPTSMTQETDAMLDPSYQITERPIGTRRPIRVACLGAGYSGLMMSIIFSQKMQSKNAELVVYERNSDIGGTWFENRYGLRN